MSAEPWDGLVSLASIVELHGEAISRYGGDGTPTPHDGCVEKSLGAAWNAELYAGPDGGVPGLCFAGCLLYYLIKNHCFIDGNKRVAWATSMEVLRGLGVTIDATDDAAEQFCLDVISGTVGDAVDVAAWLADRLVALPE